MRVHRYLPQLRPEAQFTTALFSIARNLTLNFLRDSGRRGRGHFEPVTSAARQKSVADSPDVRARKNEINEFVARAIGELAPDHREVLLLRELQGMDYDTIAGVVQCPRGTVKSRIARAREQLRIRLSEAGVLDL